MPTTLIAPRTLTDNDLARRKFFITASDAPAIMGTSSYRSAGDVWLEKLFETERTEETDAMEWGKELEPVILRHAEKRLQEFHRDKDLQVWRQGLRRTHENGIMSATLDGVVRNYNEIVEAKTHAVAHPNVQWDLWGKEEWSDAVPPWVRDQCLAQLACAPEHERVWVVLMVSFTRPRIYCIERSENLARIAEIEQRCCDFNDQYLVTGQRPADFSPSADTVKRVIVPTDPLAVAQLPDELVEQAKSLGSEYYQLGKRKDTTNAQIKALLLGFNDGVTPKGHRVHVSEVHRKAYAVEATTYSKLNIDLA